jgi:hypothetical protein
MSFLVKLFSLLAQFLLSGIVAKLIISLVVHSAILASVFLFYKNFANSSLNFALGFFNFFGFSGAVQQLQYYWLQLPQVMRDTASYFQLGAMIGYIVNSYIAGIFLAWICRRFG